MAERSKYIKHVEDCLITYASKSSNTEALKAYMGTDLPMLGVSTLSQKQLAKQKYGLKLEKSELLQVMDHVYRSSKIYEAKSASLNILDAHYKLWSGEELLEVIPNWIDEVDNWGHSDFLSKFYTRFLEDEKHRKVFLPILKKWNKHKDPWKRRQSMVALLYYARTRKNHLPFKTIISFVEPHLEAPEYFVQKGLGWTLRECYNVYPRETYLFMEASFEKISATAFTAACEKMSSAQKERLKRKRKLHRTKGGSKK